MHRWLATLRRGFNERIGWKRLGVAASLIIIAIAITTLVHMLKGVDTGVLLVALAEKPLMQVGLAASCMLGSFSSLKRPSQSVSAPRRSATRWLTDSMPRLSKSKRSTVFFISSVSAAMSWRLE